MMRRDLVAMAYGLRTTGSSAPLRPGRKNNSWKATAFRPTRFHEVCQ
jgi:hypothetical protein